MHRMIAALVAVALLVGALFATQASAVETQNPAFQRTWDRTDKPVEDLQVSRTWIWGDVVTDEPMTEPYAEAPTNFREVQYFDKSRMEINHDPAVGEDEIWFVTNGLLVVEMVEGWFQIGDDEFDMSPDPADIPIAGDPEQPTEDAPTYADINEFGLRDRPARAEGAAIIERLDGEGNIVLVPSLTGMNVTAAERVQVEGIDHTVASVFWEFMNSSGTVWEDGQYITAPLFENAFYATGYPIMEAYWATIRVGGVPQNVLFQCFERRCLTFTPGNDAGWQVEAGNVGMHYHSWRHEPQVVIPTPTATSTATATATATMTPSPTATQGTTGDLQITAINDAGNPEESVAIRNMQFSGDVNIEGWRLEDEDGNVFVFPDIVVKAGFYVTVNIREGIDIIDPQFAVLFWGLGEPFWQPGEESIRLYDGNGMVVDTYP